MYSLALAGQSWLKKLEQTGWQKTCRPLTLTIMTLDSLVYTQLLRFVPEYVLNVVICYGSLNCFVILEVILLCMFYSYLYEYW